MNNEHEILLSGPFEVTDSLGRICKVESVRIFDEGYGAIQVYAALPSADEDECLHEDAAVIRQIIARLRALGYDGPDFGAAAEDLQDERMIVLDAPEEFEAFASARGWHNLADDYRDDPACETVGMSDTDTGTAAAAVYSALMHKLGVN